MDASYTDITGHGKYKGGVTRDYTCLHVVGKSSSSYQTSAALTIPHTTYVPSLTYHICLHLIGLPFKWLQIPTETMKPTQSKNQLRRARKKAQKTEVRLKPFPPLNFILSSYTSRLLCQLKKQSHRSNCHPAPYNIHQPVRAMIFFLSQAIPCGKCTRMSLADLKTRGLKTR